MKKAQLVLFGILNSLVEIRSKKELEDFVKEKYGGWVGTAYYCLDDYDVVIKIDRDYNIISIGAESYQIKK